MKEDIKIRKAEKNDISAILSIAHSNKLELGYVKKVSIEEALERKHLIVAEIHNTIVGFQEYRHLKRKPQTTIYHNAVSKDHRKKSIGTELVNFVVREAKSLEKEFIILKCVEGLPANIFHKKYGFKIIRMERGKKRRVNVYKLKI